MSFLSVLDTIGKVAGTASSVVGSASSIYNGVVNGTSLVPVSAAAPAAVASAAPASSTPTIVYTAPVSTNSGGLSTPVLLAVAGGVLLVIVLLNKK